MCVVCGCSDNSPAHARHVQQIAGGEPGVIGHDEDNGCRLRAIEFDRIKGGKPFEIDTPWFGELLEKIGQPKGARVEVEH